MKPIHCHLRPLNHTIQHIHKTPSKDYSSSTRKVSDMDSYSGYENTTTIPQYKNSHIASIMINKHKPAHQKNHSFNNHYSNTHLNYDTQQQSSNTNENELYSLDVSDSPTQFNHMILNIDRSPQASASPNQDLSPSALGNAINSKSHFQLQQRWNHGLLTIPIPTDSQGDIIIPPTPFTSPRATSELSSSEDLKYFIQIQRESSEVVEQSGEFPQSESESLKFNQLDQIGKYARDSESLDENFERESAEAREIDEFTQLEQNLSSQQKSVTDLTTELLAGNLEYP